MCFDFCALLTFIKSDRGYKLRLNLLNHDSFPSAVKLLIALVLLHVVVHIHLLEITLHILRLVLPHHVLGYHEILALLHI